MRRLRGEDLPHARLPGHGEGAEALGGVLVREGAGEHADAGPPVHRRAHTADEGGTVRTQTLGKLEPRLDRLPLSDHAGHLDVEPAALGVIFRTGGLDGGGLAPAGICST